MTATTTSGTALLKPLPQHLDALQRANAVRDRQATIKRRVKEGRLHVDALLVGAADLDDDERAALERLTVGSLILAARKVGTTRLGLILAGASRRVTPPTIISDRKRIGALTVRQRHALAAELRDRIPESCYRGVSS